jgi:hypothetical protein
MRWRLIGSGALRDFAVVGQLAVAGGTDYFAELIPVGRVSEAFPDSGLGFSFATIMPTASAIAISTCSRRFCRRRRSRSDAEHTMAAGLLDAYLGPDASVAFMPAWSS